jgi:outer membrane protein TolC
MSRLSLILVILATSLASTLRAGQGDGSDFTVLNKPLSKIEALNLAIVHNGIIRQAQKEVEAAVGVSIQTKAILFPHVIHTSGYEFRQDSLIEANRDLEIPSTTIHLPKPLGSVEFGGGTRSKVNNQSWANEIQIVQSIYEGGRMLSAARSSRLIKEQAVLAFQSTVADTLLSVSNAYDDALRGGKQVEVRDAEVKFLTAYLGDIQERLKAGTIPEFDVIRGQVELANGVAQQVQALGDYRVAKQKLVEQLGYNVAPNVSDDLALNLTSPLEARPYPNTLTAALTEALQNRTEIAALEKEERLQDENIIVAKAGTKPSVQAFAGYELTSRLQTRNAGDELHGGLVGAQVSWPIFDGFLTKGRVVQAEAQRGKAAEAKAETMRIVEFQVRNAWSDLRTALSVLDAQIQNLKKAQRALELADIRYKEGAGTQIDVLSAQTALTDAHGSMVDALRNYSVARASLIRATGADLQRK